MRQLNSPATPQQQAPELPRLGGQAKVASTAETGWLIVPCFPQHVFEVRHFLLNQLDPHTIQFLDLF